VSKTIAIMQPYFMPYIGYWQLMAAVDQFVVYDNIQYTKKGWINKNRFLRNGSAAVFSLPLKRGSSFLNVKDRYLSDDFQKEAARLLRQIEGSYKHAPNFEATFTLFEKCMTYDNKNLFDFIYNSIIVIKEHMGIKTRIIISSSINIDHSLLSADKVKAICHALKAKKYINPIGGSELYSKNDFHSDGIELLFHQSLPVKYKQFEHKFQPWLSVIDVLMFNCKDQLSACLKKYEFL
jgi:hypothetical protein